MLDLKTFSHQGEMYTRVPSILVTPSVPAGAQSVPAGIDHRYVRSEDTDEPHTGNM